MKIPDPAGKLHGWVASGRAGTGACRQTLVSVTSGAPSQLTR